MTVGRRTGVRLLWGLFVNVVLDMGLCLRLDVLVDAEEVAGVVDCLDLRQPAVVAAVPCPHAFVPFEIATSSPPGRRARAPRWRSHPSRLQPDPRLLAVRAQLTIG